MTRPSLLFASPCPPRETGVADYAAGLAPALQEYFDVTLYTGADQISDAALGGLPVLRYGEPVPFARFDHRLYQIGNNPFHHSYIYRDCLRYPGVVDLHEPVIYFLTAGVYYGMPEFFSRLYEIGGAAAVRAMVRLRKQGSHPYDYNEPATLPLNRELLRSGNRIIVHSEHARRMLQPAAPPDARIDCIPLAQRPPLSRTPRPRTETLARLGIPPHAVVLASFGFVAAVKLNHVLCRVTQSFENLHYVMVGAGVDAASLRGDRIHVTGFVGEEEYDDCLAAADLVANLRYPSMGESSAALLRAMQAEKPCVVSKIGWFDELPDYAVLKISAEPDRAEAQLPRAIGVFLQDRRPFDRMARAAAAYVRRKHSAPRVAKEFYRLLCGTASQPAAPSTGRRLPHAAPENSRPAEPHPPEAR
jgi:glycosyltransferase involved in cell wall biosynthesis